MRKILVYLPLIFSWGIDSKIEAMDPRPISATTTITESYSPFSSPDDLDDATLPLFSPRNSPSGLVAPTPVEDAPPRTPPNSARKSSGRFSLFSPVLPEASVEEEDAFPPVFLKGGGWDLDNSRIACRAIIEAQGDPHGVLKKIAEEGQFGYKAANLLLLQADGPSLRALFSPLLPSIPSFFPISSLEIIAALSRQGCDIHKEWSSAVAHLRRERKFTAVFQKAHQHFIEELSQALDALTLKNSELIAFLGKIAAKDARLMVRSTGREDTHHNANAGGNKSVPNVLPYLPVVLGAIKEVVLSYFSERSLKQRIDAHDESVFSNDVFIPVLLQEMVGEGDSEKKGSAGSFEGEAEESNDSASAEKYAASEKYGAPMSSRVAGTGDVGDDVSGSEVSSTDEGDEAAGDIPCSGVMFTQDPESRTPDIMVIQSIWGHNEAVVNSLLPVDTYYVAGKAIYPIIRKKSSRLVPRRGEGLGLVANPDHLANASSLNKARLASLIAIGRHLEEVYRTALDIEFVIQKKKVHIVQARPIVHARDLAPASYIHGELPGERFSGVTVGAAGGSVRVIENAELIVGARTISDALNNYHLLPREKRQAIKLIVVGEMAASTSHAATVFRGQGKPLIFFSRWQELLKGMVGDKKVVVDVQRAAAWLCSSDIEEGSHLREGWFSYPASPVLSVFPGLEASLDWEPAYLDMRIDEARSFLDRLAVQAGGRTETKPGGAAVGEGRTVVAVDALDGLGGDALDALEGEALEEERERVIVEQLEKRTIDLLSAYRRALPFDAALQEEADFLLKALHRVLHRIIQCRGETLRMERLLHIQFLQALLRQQEDRDQIARPYSLASLVNVLKKEERIIEQADRLGLTDSRREQYIQLYKVKEIIHNPTLAAAWEELLQQCTADPILMNKLAQIIKMLHQYKIVPLWLHTEFARLINEAPTIPLEAKLEQWYVPLTRSHLFLEKLSQLRMRIEQVDVTAFSEESSLAAAWNTFERDIMNYFFSSIFTGAFNRAEPLVRAIACQVLYEAVDKFDLVIKAMKGSSTIPILVRVGWFKRMLQIYKDFLYTVMNLEVVKSVSATGGVSAVPLKDTIEYGKYGGRSKESATGRIIETRTQRFEDYQDLIERLIERELTEEDLEGTPGINIPSFTIRSGMNLDCNTLKPRFAEDAFSIIHQSLLVALNELQKASFITLSPLLLKVEEMLAFHAVVKLGQVVAAGGMQTFYSRALNSHGCQFTAHYKHRQSDVDLTVRFYGESPKRWYVIGSMALLLEFARICSVRDFKCSKGVEFTLELKEETDLSLVGDMINQMIQYSYTLAKNWTDVDIKKFVFGFPSPLPEAMIEESVVSRLGTGSDKAEMNDIFWFKDYCQWLKIRRASPAEIEKMVMRLFGSKPLAIKSFEIIMATENGEEVLARMVDSLPADNLELVHKKLELYRALIPLQKTSRFRFAYETAVTNLNTKKEQALIVLKAVVTRGLEEDAAKAVDIANHVKGIVLDSSSSVHTHKLALLILVGLVARGWSAEEILKSSKDVLASPLLFSFLIKTYVEVADLICLIAQKEYSERSSIDAIVIDAALLFITKTNSIKQANSTVKKVKERFAGFGINLEEIAVTAASGKPGEAKKVG